MLFELRMLAYRFLKLFMKPVVKLVPQPRPVVLVGPGAALRLCRLLGEFRFTRVLVVTDSVLARLGLIAPLERALAEQGIAVAVFDGVQPDPTYPVVGKGHAAAIAHRCDAILAVGGGSAIDAAKIIAAMVTSGKRPEKLLGFFRLTKPMLPLFVVPTTAGTGSEVTVAAVLTDPAKHVKAAAVDPRLVPAAAALDAKLMQNMPKHVTAATGMDALTHAVEAYLNLWPNAETAFHSIAAVRMIFANLPRAYSDGMDLEAREAMALGSFYGGLAFTKAYVGYVHAFSHKIGGTYGVPHGLGNAITLPYVLDFVKDAPYAEARLAELAVSIGESRTDPVSGAVRSDAALAQRFVDRVRGLNGQIGIPDKITALNPTDIPAIARAAMIEANRDYPVPKRMRLAEAEALLARMLPRPA
jgi:alcohol dehydrogenase class IV